MRKTIAVIAVALGALGTSARADVIEVNSTTFLTAAQQTRGGLAGQTPDLVTVVPAYELMSITATGVTNPIADDLRISVSVWGSYELADPRWDKGPGAVAPGDAGSDLTGDVMTAYVSGRFVDRRLQLRLGRTHVGTGVARMIQLDGGEAIVFVPGGFRISGYAGVPVSQRFASRGTLVSWNPVGGDLAYGGRAAWSLAIPGVAGRGLDVGVSANFVQDGSEPVRDEVGADLRVQPLGNLTIAGFGAYALEDERLAEGNVSATWSVTRRLNLIADWRYLAPDLLLTRNSILSVFSDLPRNVLGGGAEYEVGHGLSVGAAYRASLEPGEDPEDDTFVGSEADVSVEWEQGATLAGAEGFFVDSFENGYTGGRIFARREFGKFFGAADVLAHFFNEDVNGESTAVTGTLSAGVKLAKGFSAVVAGRAGVTPFMEQTYDVMAKLVYNQTYSRREVR